MVTNSLTAWKNTCRLASKHEWTLLLAQLSLKPAPLPQKIVKVNKTQQDFIYNACNMCRHYLWQQTRAHTQAQLLSTYVGICLYVYVPATLGGAIVCMRCTLTRWLVNYALAMPLNYPACPPVCLPAHLAVVVAWPPSRRAHAQTAAVAGVWGAFHAGRRAGGRQAVRPTKQHIYFAVTTRRLGCASGCDCGWGSGYHSGGASMQPIACPIQHVCRRQLTLLISGFAMLFIELLIVLSHLLKMRSCWECCCYAKRNVDNVRTVMTTYENNGEDEVSRLYV